MTAKEQNKSILYMLIASFSFALVGACTRILRNDIPSVELVFFRNVIGAVFILYFLIRRPPVQVGGRPFLLAFRGIIGTIALYFFFYGIAKIGLAEAITYQQSYPVFLAVFAFAVFGEKLLAREWLAIIIGFVGILFIFLPQMQDTHLSFRNHSIGVLNAIFTGMAYLSIRGLAKYYDTRSTVMSFMVAGIVLPIISMAVGTLGYGIEYDFLIAEYTSPHGVEWLWIAVLGIAALIGQIFLTRAFSFEKTGVIAAVGYSNIVFSVFFGVLLGDPIPTIASFVGICLIVISGISISRPRKVRIG